MSPALHQTLDTIADQPNARAARIGVAAIEWRRQGATALGLIGIY